MFYDAGAMYDSTTSAYDSVTVGGSLLHSPADIVSRLLTAFGYGVDPSVPGEWPVNVAREPNTPDDAITVYDTQGRDDGRTMVDGERQEHHGFQVRVRSMTHPAGYAKARSIADALDQGVLFTQVDVDGTTYTVFAVTRTSDVIAIGKEAELSKRSLFTINAIAAIRRN